MKKITIFWMCVLSFLIISCKDNASSKIKETNLETAKERDEKISEGGAKIAFDKTDYDFGTVTEGDVVEGTFKITNEGKSDLVILSAHASCGCTVPKWPKEAIKPGDSADLTFSFNSRGRSGKQSKSITLQTNSEKVTQTLRISGMVNPKS